MKFPAENPPRRHEAEPRFSEERASGMFFWQKKQEKWHEVRWFNGPRDIYLALKFADEKAAAAPEPAVPAIERLTSKDAAANAAQPPIDEPSLAAAIASEVTTYNRKNHFFLKVAGIRYRAKGGADVADHASAARKLLNLL